MFATQFYEPMAIWKMTQCLGKKNFKLTTDLNQYKHISYRFPRKSCFIRLVKDHKLKS